MQHIPLSYPTPLRCDIVVGTRPEAIKLAPVVKALRESGDDFIAHVVTSGQHGEICRSALAAFGLAPDSVLDAEPISGSLAASAGYVLQAFGRRYSESRPDLIVVQGDTTTAMAAALAGFYARIPVAHVEAGLRSGDLAHPFPEEANRQVIDSVSAIFGNRWHARHAAMAPFATQPTQEPALQQLGVEAIGFCPAMLPRDRDTRGVDHVRLDPTRLKPTRQPEAVAAGFEGKRNPCDIGAGPDRLIAPAMQQGKQPFWVRLQLLAWLTLNAGKHTAN